MVNKRSNNKKLKNIINQVNYSKKIELNIFNNITNNDYNNIIIDMNNTEVINPVQVNEKKNKLSKQILGQFYTTNQEYILQGMKIPNDIKNIIEPFTGNGDLIKFIEKIIKNI